MNGLFLIIAVITSTEVTECIEEIAAETAEVSSVSSNCIMIILQIATLFISLASLIVGAYVQISQNKKTLFSNQVITQRLNDLNTIRAAAAEFLTLVDTHYIDNISSFEEYRYNLTKAMSTLKCLLKPKYDIDLKIIELIEEAYKYSVRLSQTDKTDTHKKTANDNRNKLDLVVKELYDEISKYNQSNWECVKAQAGGTPLSYTEFKSKFNE